MIDREYELETLNKLKNDLKDINTYTNFKDGTYFYDLGYFQGSLLVDEIDRLNNIINELEKWLTKKYENNEVEFFIYEVLDKLKELKEDNK